MKVDKKSIQVFLWKTITYSTVALCKFAKDYPYAYGVFLIFLLLYLYVPLVFYVLVFSSPILVCTIISVRFYRANLRKKHGKKEMEAMAKTANEKPCAKSKVKDILVTKSEKGLRAQKSVRRNRRNENIELDTQVNKLERKGDRLTSPSPFDDFISGGADLLEEKYKLLEEEERVSDHGQSSSPHEDPDPDPAPCETSAGESVEFPNAVVDQKEAVESTDDEEESREFKHDNKAVAWTKDDERNLIDLGLSELERNKRLESLMARRRARKLFRLAVEKTLMGQESIHPTQMAPVSTARISPFDGSSIVNGTIPYMPGSAPSVMIPRHNPFDLPYEPQEEKPNLTGDSFDEEFLVPNQKDMFLSRHESFRCGSCHRQDSPGVQLASGLFLGKSFLQELEHARDKKFSDKASHRENISLVVGSPEEVPNSEVVENQAQEEAKMEEEKDNGSESITPEIQLENMDNGKEELEAQTGNEAIERAETESMNDNGSCSSSSSDSDGLIILNEKKRFPQVLTDHVQKALSLSTPPKSVAMKRNAQDWSPVAIERNRAEDHMFFRNRVAWHTHTQSISSDMQVEFSDIGSPPLTIDETASPTDEVSQICDEDIERAIARQRDTLGQRNELKGNEQDEVDKEDSVDAGSSGENGKHEEVATNLHGTSLPSAASKITGDDAQPHQSVINQTNQVQPGVDPDVIYDVEESTFRGEASTSNKDDEIQVLTKNQVIESEPNQVSVDKYDMSHVHNTNSEPEETRDQKQTSGFTTDVAGQSENPTEEKVEEVPEAVRNQEDPRSGLDTGDLHGVTQNDLSNVPNGLVIEHRSTSSGSSASPTSVLLNDVLARQLSASNLEEPMQMDVIMDSDVENLSQSNLTPYGQQDAQQLISNSVSQSDSDPANLTKEESKSKTKSGEVGENQSNIAEENSRSNAKEISSSGQVIHEGNIINDVRDQNVNEKKDQLSQSEKAMETEPDISTSETEEERTTKLKEESSSGLVIHEGNSINDSRDRNVDEKREHVPESEKAKETEADISTPETEEESSTKLKEKPEAGEIEEAGQGNGSSPVQEVVEHSKPSIDTLDSKHELVKPADKEDDTEPSKLEEERNSSNENQGREILDKVEGLY